MKLREYLLIIRDKVKDMIIAETDNAKREVEKQWLESLEQIMTICSDRNKF